MSHVLFSAIESGDPAALEKCLEKGVSPVSVNEKGLHPLTFVASLIQKNYEEGRYEAEERYRKMAAMLIVHGAPETDLEHACGEVTNLARHICRYVVELCLHQHDIRRVAELIEMKRLWFQNDSKMLEKTLLEAIERGEKRRVDTMFDREQVHCAYEQ